MLHYNIDELQDIANELAIECFLTSLNIPVVYNTKLKNAMGRFGADNKGMRIELQPMTEYTLETFIGVLKHELCHWYCYINNKPYNDGDEYFENHIKRINAPSTNEIEAYTRLQAFACSNMNCNNPKKLYTRTAKSYHRLKVKGAVCPLCGANVTYIGVRYHNGQKYMEQGESEHIERLRKQAMREIRKQKVKLNKLKSSL